MKLCVLLVGLMLLLARPSWEQAPGVQQFVGQFHDKYGKEPDYSFFGFPYRTFNNLNPLNGAFGNGLRRGLGNIVNGGRAGRGNGGFDFGLSTIGNLAGSVFGGRPGGRGPGSGASGFFRRRRRSVYIN